MRTLISALCDVVDRLGGPCFVSWAHSRWPTFREWFWKD